MGTGTTRHTGVPVWFDDRQHVGRAPLEADLTTEVVAAYRDEEGELHTMSASCPHLGCLVDFEAVAGEWQCPCHGSRFDPTGHVLEGPATRGLARVDGPGR